MKEQRARALGGALLGLGAGILCGFALRGWAARRGGPGDVLLRRDDGDGDEPLAEERPTCEPDFQFRRQSAAFYRRTTDGRVSAVRACDDPAPLQVPERVTIPVHWAVIGTGWTTDAAKAKLDEAAAWFARYCIVLSVQPVNLRPHEAAALQNRVQRADTGADAFAEECKKVYRSLWNRVGRPRSLLVILFLDAFRAVRYGDRVDRVAGNFEKFPLILIPSDPDTRSIHIVTHELIHGLGKERNETAAPPSTSVAGSGEGRINTWEEGSCANDMGNAGRQDPTGPLTKNDSDLLDWASYHQFLANAKTIG